MGTRPALALALTLLTTCAAASAQQPPRPFPQPSQSRPSAPPVTTTAPAAPPQTAAPPGVPNEQTLGVPVYPTAQFITSYDAGRGQRFYLFGVALSFTEVVTYYRTTLKTRGEALFETPATHQFEIARYREDLMAFPPSVTIKDYTFGGSAGYPNPSPDGEPQRFPTIIQIVPAPGAGPGR